MGIDVIANSCFQAARAAKDTAPELVRGQESKPTLDEIEPRSAGGREVKMKTWALEQPTLNGRGLMSTIVIEDQMHVEPWRHLRLDLVEELAKLQRTVAAMKLTDDLAALSVQRCEQRSCPMALVIMSPAFCLSWAHGQSWLRAIQSLNLRLLVDTQYQCLIRRIQVKPNDISDLVDEQRIPGKFESLAAVRGQSESAPHSLDTATTQAASRCQRAVAPVRCILRRRLQRHGQHSLHFNITKSPRRARSRLIQQTIEPFVQKATAPLANRLLGHAQALRHRCIRFPLGTHQNDACALRQCLARLRSPRPLLQRLAFILCQAQRWYRSTCSHQILLYN